MKTEVAGRAWKEKRNGEFTGRWVATSTSAATRLVAGRSGRELRPRA